MIVPCDDVGRRSNAFPKKTELKNQVRTAGSRPSAGSLHAGRKGPAAQPGSPWGFVYGTIESIIAKYT